MEKKMRRLDECTHRNAGVELTAPNQGSCLEVLRVDVAAKLMVLVGFPGYVLLVDF